MGIKNEVLRYNRQPELGAWFSKQLDHLIATGYYLPNGEQLAESITTNLVNYRQSSGKNTVVIGMSGGIDSATTAALFKKAGYDVIGVLLPIYQEQVEIDRAMSACQQLGIEYLSIDLTSEYDMLVARSTVLYDTFLMRGIRRSDAVRRGNIRARLRMITLYNIAQMKEGFVASTDNFSELAAGFWTLHGDVGDVAPIQSMLKSWEVPMLAEHLNVPSSIVEAVPTDGLGIANGDEDQLGYSYLHFDIGLLTLMKSNLSDVLSSIDNEEEQAILISIAERIKGTAFKRSNPYNLAHPVDHTRYDMLASLDGALAKELMKKD